MTPIAQQRARVVLVCGSRDGHSVSHADLVASTLSAARLPARAHDHLAGRLSARPNAELSHRIPHSVFTGFTCFSIHYYCILLLLACSLQIELHKSNQLPC